MSGSKRKKTPQEIETDVLTNSARRCALCFHLQANLDQQDGQIAHLDKDSANSVYDNLAFLCIPHHSHYDSKTSQHKNYTETEVKRARDKLYKLVETGLLHRNPYKVSLSFDQLNLILETLNQRYSNLKKIEAEAADMQDPGTIAAIEKRSDLYALIEHLKN
jgi:hypothetical protein